MSTKYLRVTMPDGSKWDIPASAIADNKANYHAKDKEDPKESLELYNEEYKLALGDDGELIEWAKGNMDWADVQHIAMRAHEPDETSYESGWCNADMEIVEANIV